MSDGCPTENLEGKASSSKLDSCVATLPKLTCFPNSGVDGAWSSIKSNTLVSMTPLSRAKPSHMRSIVGASGLSFGALGTSRDHLLPTSLVLLSFQSIFIVVILEKMDIAIVY